VEDKRRRESSSERLNKVKRRFQKVLSQNEPGNLPAVQRARPNQVNPLRGCARAYRRRRFYHIYVKIFAQGPVGKALLDSGVNIFWKIPPPLVQILWS
jgi:hypothetical protein